MPRLPVHFIFSMCFLSAQSYSYQTKPLFLTNSELATLEDASDSEDPSAAEDHQALVVICHGDSTEIVMRPHLLDPGLPELLGLRLGPSGSGWEQCSAGRSADGEFIIRAPLAECGSRMMVTGSVVLYTNTLLFFFTGSSAGETLQIQGAAIPVLCRYRRRYAVSSGALRPTWTPLISVHSAHLGLDFYLSLMTDDWSSERKSPFYSMSEMVNIQASVDHHRHHHPLRLYAGSCVATLTPDVDSDPRYAFIERQGCFTDSQLSDSGSRFLPRVRDDLLHIQLQPFLFHQDQRNSIYITCYLEAVPLSKMNSEKKACSFISGRWRSADGDEHACESCDRGPVGLVHERAQRSSRLNELHRETTLGPIMFLPLQDDSKPDSVERN